MLGLGPSDGLQLDILDQQNVPLDNLQLFPSPPADSLRSHAIIYFSGVYTLPVP